MHLVDLSAENYASDLEPGADNLFLAVRPLAAHLIDTRHRFDDTDRRDKAVNLLAHLGVLLVPPQYEDHEDFADAAWIGTSLRTAIDPHDDEDGEEARDFLETEIVRLIRVIQSAPNSKPTRG